MEYYVSPTAVSRLRYDKPNILLDESVSAYLSHHKKEIIVKSERKSHLNLLLVQNLRFYTYKRFRDEQELMGVLMTILAEICLDEINDAIQRFNEHGINKCVNYLLSCVE